MLVRMRDDFWELWRRTYLQSLQPRPKWLKPSPNLSVGDMVLIKQENVPPAQWPIARVTELHPGPDGLVCTVSLKTETDEFTRPIVKLVLLPLESN